MNNSKESVIVEAIYDAKEGNNQEFKTLQLRVTKVTKNFLNDLLGSDGFESSKVAFQPIKESVLTAKGIAIGDDLGAKMGSDLRIVHSEALSAIDPGYRALENPETGQAVTCGGAQMYFKRELGDATTPDTFLQRDSVSVEASAPIVSEEA